MAFSVSFYSSLNLECTLEIYDMSTHESPYGYSNGFSFDLNPGMNQRTNIKLRSSLSLDDDTIGTYFSNSL